MQPETISSSMSEPSERIDQRSNGFSVTYHWADKENKHTFLYLFFSKKNLPDRSFYVVESNVDSSEVKGQGDKLWLFMTKKIAQISKSGISDKEVLPIIHEVHPNKFSLRLVESDNRYINRDGVFYGFF